MPLLLEGRKKLARMSDSYPPMTFDGEDRFDHWVALGKLHREEVIEPFDMRIRGFLGIRTVYYTLKGKEWRIPAMKLVWDASQQSGGWNEYFERLEGMLFGYQQAESDWWINEGLNGGGFGGISLCCAVNAAGLAWMEAAGFRALPPIDKPSLRIVGFRKDQPAVMRAILLDESDSVALVRFGVRGRYLVELLDLRRGGPWDIRSDQIPGLNRELRGSVTILTQRND